MRLLIADKLHPRAIEELRSLPLEVEYEPELNRESLEHRLPSAGILVVRSTPVTEKAIEGAKQLNLIVRAGAGYATIDVRAASRRGIYVANCPGKNASAVAELAFGLLIAIDRRIVDANVALRAGKFQRAEYGKAEGLYGKTMGIAGLGAIGREVAHRAKAFGLNVIGSSRSLTPARAAEMGIGYSPNIEELASRSDILTLHLALVDRTRGIVNKRIFDALPHGAIFINTARADLVDHEAMRRAVSERALRVGIDVVPDEPRASTEYKNDLFSAAKVRVIRSFLLEGHVPNVVNVLNASVARFQLVIRMQDKVGTFANVLNVIKRHGINVEEIANTVFEGGGAACAKLRLVSRPSEACLHEIRAFDEVLHVDVVTLPNLA